MDIDVNYQQENKRRPNFQGKSLHENVYSSLTKKKDSSYSDYIKTQKKYSKLS